MAGRLSLYFPKTGIYCDVDPRREFVAGISDTCDLDLKRYFQGDQIRIISRRHFKITFIEDEGFAIYDLNSLNGTRVNGKRLTPGEPKFLKEGDSIMLVENKDFVMEVSSDDFGHTQPLQLVPEVQVVRVPEVKGLLTLLPDGRFVVDGIHIPHTFLTALEQRLLSYLYAHSGQICSYEELIEHVWQYPRADTIHDNAVAKLVSNLRKKLDGISRGAGSRYIQTVHGRGVTCIPNVSP